MRRLLPVLIAASLLAACDSGGGGGARPEPLPPPQITRAELVEHLAALQRIANRNGGTRAAGTPGYAASAGYVAARLREAGWHVTRQPLPFTLFRLRRASLRVGGRTLTREHDYQVPSYSGSGRAAGGLRAAGDGCSSADFAGIGGGDIPLVSSGGCLYRDKAQNAQRAGARALVVVQKVASRRGVPSGTLVVQGIRIPVVVASLRALAGIAEGVPASVMVRATTRPARTQNVIAETRGGRGDQVVMAGGHLDSVAGGPGINDNGSAAATLIELAEAIGPDPPGARVRVAFWGAEELGLVGSRRYVSSLGAGERKRVRAYINLDMVGSPNPVPAVYADADAELERVLRDAVGTKVRGVRVGGASDHLPFRIAGIPVGGLYTGASELGPGRRPRDPCYHLSCDTIRNVNRAALLEMARAAARALRVLIVFDERDIEPGELEPVYAK